MLAFGVSTGGGTRGSVILEEILAHKQGEVALAKARLPQGEIEL